MTFVDGCPVQLDVSSRVVLVTRNTMNNKYGVGGGGAGLGGHIVPSKRRPLAKSTSHGLDSRRTVRPNRPEHDQLIRSEAFLSEPTNGRAHRRKLIPLHLSILGAFE